MKMQQRKFRIGQLAKNLEIKEFVIRFWEKEFDIIPDRSNGKQRFYSQKDFEKFKKIKELLYEKRYTINGAKKELCENKNNRILNNKEFIASTKTTIDKNEDLVKELKKLQKQLVQLKQLL